MQPGCLFKGVFGQKFEVKELNRFYSEMKDLETCDSEVSGEKLSEKYKKVGENGMGEEIIETIGGSGGEENMTEVSEINEAQGKPAESG